MSDLCRELGIRDATFYNWKAKYGGMSSFALMQIKELEAENARLKRMYATSYAGPAALLPLVLGGLERVE